MAVLTTKSRGKINELSYGRDLSRVVGLLIFAILAIYQAEAQYENIWTGPTNVVFRDHSSYMTSMIYHFYQDFLPNRSFRKCEIFLERLVDPPPSVIRVDVIYLDGPLAMKAEATQPFPPTTAKIPASPVPTADL